jgi:Zn-dependent peptidase ImmA (M78 family)
MGAVMRRLRPILQAGATRATACTPVRAEAEEVASGLRDLVQVRPNDRLNLHAVARSLGVFAISFVPLTVDGRVESTPEGAHIRIRENMSDTRKRFTLAHELAHLALGHVGTRSRSTELAAEREERLCDAIAAALLMPRPLVESWLANREPTVDGLIEMASNAGVSRHALVRRVNEVAHRTCLLIQFRRTKDYWVALPETFGRVPVTGPRRPRLSKSANMVLEGVTRDTPVELVLRFGPQAFLASGTASIQEGTSRKGPLIQALVTALERDRTRDSPDMERRG